MGNLFPNSAEFPDFRPAPNVVLDAARLGLPPLLIAVIIIHATKPTAPRVEVASVPAATSVTELPTPTEFGEDPHTHNETGDPTPRALANESGSTTSAPDIPFVPNHDASADVIRQHYARRTAAFIAATAMSSTSSAILF